MKAVFVPLVVALTLTVPLLAHPTLAQSGAPEDPGSPEEPPGPPPVPLELTLAGDAAVVDQVTPGEPVALVFLGRALRGFGPKSLFGALWVPDDDGDGAVRFELEPGIDPASSWVAVDLATGRTATATPEGFEARVRPVPETALETAEDGLIRGLRRSNRFTWVALARPGDEATRAETGRRSPPAPPSYATSRFPPPSSTRSATPTRTVSWRRPNTRPRRVSASAFFCWIRPSTPAPGFPARAAIPPASRPRISTTPWIGAPGRGPRAATAPGLNSGT